MIIDLSAPRGPDEDECRNCGQRIIWRSPLLRWVHARNGMVICMLPRAPKRPVATPTED